MNTVELKIVPDEELEKVFWKKKETIKFYKEYKVSDALLEKYDTYIDWESLLAHQTLTDEQIEKYYDEYNIESYMLSTYPFLSPALLEKYKDDLDWSLISNYQNIELFLKPQYEEYIEWDTLSYRSDELTLEQIEAFKHKWNWQYITTKKDISLAFISQYKDYVDWELICKYKTLTEEFMSNHVDCLNWKQVSSKQPMSTSFILAHLQHIDSEQLKQNKNINKKELRKHQIHVALKLMGK